MALDIFSSFDDHHNVLCNSYIIIWTPVLFTSLFFLNFHQNSPFINVMSDIITNTAHTLIYATNARGIGSTLSVLSAVLTLLITLNLTGLAPFLFSSTSHLTINLSIALPIWLCVITLSATFNFNIFIAHFQPIGAPSPLNPFLVLIELVSVCVRPLTLIVRLSANLSAGHILIALLGGAFSTSGLSSTSILISLIGCFYFIFEIAVCLVQAYIFTLLSSLYLDEHPN